MTELANITTCPTPPPTEPPPPTEYMIEIEIDTVDVVELQELKTLLQTFHLPFVLSDFQITELNITTDITTCPTPPPTEPPPPTEYMIEIEIDTMDVAELQELKTLLQTLHLPFVLSDFQITELNITTDITTCPTPPPTEPPPPTEYMIEIEIDTVDVAELQELRILLQTFHLPFVLSDFQITELNITTDITTCPTPPPTEPPPPTEYMIEIEIDTVDVAELQELRILLQTFHLPFVLSDFQITELNITTDITTCPTPPPTEPPPPTEYMIEIEIDTVDVVELQELRTLLQTFHLPSVLSDFQITELNITTDITTCPTPPPTGEL
ncbi:hypothetical protein NFI96_009091 [Prochilodus magdalenae]|nr:hypothetical protein NFI96_009091 [Prochilodus magdalenae]